MVAVGTAYDNLTWGTGQQGNPITIFGPQTVWVIVELGSCIATDTLLVLPEAGSQAPVLTDGSACLGTAVELDATVSGTDITYTWSTGEASASINAPAGDTYTVSVTGLCGTVTATATIEGINCNVEDSLFIPNVVTLNNDGMNDVWRVQSGAVESIEMKIFSRWGKLIWEGKSLIDAWDGTRNGRTLQDGTYFYVVRIRSLTGELILKHGTVTLLH